MQDSPESLSIHYSVLLKGTCFARSFGPTIAHHVRVQSFIVTELLATRHKICPRLLFPKTLLHFNKNKSMNENISIRNGNNLRHYISSIIGTDATETLRGWTPNSNIIYMRSSKGIWVPDGKRILHSQLSSHHFMTPRIGGPLIRACVDQTFRLQEARFVRCCSVVVIFNFCNVWAMSHEHDRNQSASIPRRQISKIYYCTVSTSAASITITTPQSNNARTMAKRLQRKMRKKFHNALEKASPTRTEDTRSL